MTGHGKEQTVRSASSSELPSSAEVVVIGAGVNGLATAFELTRRGIRDVVILERSLCRCGRIR